MITVIKYDKNENIVFVMSNLEFVEHDVNWESSTGSDVIKVDFMYTDQQTKGKFFLEPGEYVEVFQHGHKIGTRIYNDPYKGKGTSNG